MTLDCGRLSWATLYFTGESSHIAWGLS